MSKPRIIFCFNFRIQPALKLGLFITLLKIPPRHSDTCLFHFCLGHFAHRAGEVGFIQPLGEVGTVFSSCPRSIGHVILHTGRIRGVGGCLRHPEHRRRKKKGTEATGFRSGKIDRTQFSFRPSVLGYTPRAGDTGASAELRNRINFDLASRLVLFQMPAFQT